MFEDRVPIVFVNGNIDKFCNPADFTRHVGLERREVQQHQVRQMPNLPPGPDVVPEPPERVSVILEPDLKILVDLVLRRPGRFDTRTTNRIDLLIKKIVVCTVVVVIAPQHISTVTRDVYVFGLWRINKRIDRKMCLYETAMRLRLDRWKFHFLRWQAQVNPRRHLGNVSVGRTIENQLRKYLLNPGRARFRIGRDYDVVVAYRKIIPKSRIEMIVVKLARFFRPCDLERV